jgi:hypothetical protein
MADRSGGSFPCDYDNVNPRREVLRERRGHSVQKN